jgi:phage terminase small subunit
MVEALSLARKRRFAKEYMRDLNQRQAAIRTGFSQVSAGNSGHRLMKDRYVQEQIAKAQAEFAIKYDITEAKIIRSIIDIGEEARAAGNHAVALKAKELVGRHIGMWPNTVRTEITGAGGGPVRVAQATVVLPIESMSPEQREALRSALLLAKAKERAMTEAQEGEEEE